MKHEAALSFEAIGGTEAWQPAARERCLAIVIFEHRFVIIATGTPGKWQADQEGGKMDR